MNNIHAQEVSKISGEIPEIETGKIILLTPTPMGMDTLGSGFIRNNKFSIDIDLKEPLIGQLKVDGYEGGFIAILEPGENYNALLKQNEPSQIRGGKLQEAYINYLDKIQQHNSTLRKIRAELAEANTAKHYRTASTLNKKLDSAQNSANSELEAIVTKYRGTYLASYILTKGVQKADLATMENIYASLNEKERNLQPGRIYAAYIKDLKSLNVGSLAPDFTLKDNYGKDHNLHSTAAKIKIIDFWASWCGPCRLENPNMIKLYNTYKASGLQVIGVSLDQKHEPWLKAIQEDKINWTHLIVENAWQSKVVKQYNIDAVPTIYVLDSNNKIIAKNLRGKALHDFVEDYLSK
ncbi:TlpA disulfide reductase family protein [Sphingobacterium bovistauri]|uniref:AhpC/TSA family protein n=1 Tax=Sphingobacterium bovistauri TaxID=2781959 RepID=A0ABS7Z0J1_9SPHI|nr:TlpA disulfide reductase family protein [Sphingobacterium bovistauri]MCA5003646.1 AhpC/TSA family protein [Sphingobacterium bovistauri]